MGRKTREAISVILARQYRSVGITDVDTPADLEALIALRPDLVFLAMKFIPSELSLGVNDPAKLWISEQLDVAGIAYTGSNAPAVKLEASKQLAKQRVLDAGLASPHYTIIHRHLPQTVQSLPTSFPVFVKPSNRGGGVGIGPDSFVQDTSELTAKINALASELQADALVETYLPGREFSVSILQHLDADTASVMPVELVTEPDERGARVLGQKIKSSNVEQALEVTDPLLRRVVCALAYDVFEALGARDYGRIDIRLDSHGVPHFLEANLYPSLTSGYGSFPKAYAFDSDQSYEQMIISIAQLGLARSSDDAEEFPALYGELVTA